MHRCRKFCLSTAMMRLISENLCFVSELNRLLVIVRGLKKHCFKFFNLPLKTPSQKHSNESRSICSHLFYGNELFPSFPWLLTQPVTATCKPLHRERGRRERTEVGRGGETERVGADTTALGEKWTSVGRKT